MYFCPPICSPWRILDRSTSSWDAESYFGHNAYALIKGPILCSSACSLPTFSILHLRYPISPTSPPTPTRNDHVELPDDHPFQAGGHASDHAD